jgi:hypothetical protein
VENPRASAFLQASESMPGIAQTAVYMLNNNLLQGCYILLQLEINIVGWCLYFHRIQFTKPFTSCLYYFLSAGWCCWSSIRNRPLLKLHYP